MSDERHKSLPPLCIVTFEYPPFAGGISSYAYNMALEAVKLCPVELIAPRYSEAAAGAIAVHRLLDHHNLTPGNLWRALRQIAITPRGTLIHAADVRAGAVAFTSAAWIS